MGSWPARLATGEPAAQAVRLDRRRGPTRLGRMSRANQGSRDEAAGERATPRSRGFAPLWAATVGSAKTWAGNLPRRRDGCVLSCVCRHAGALIAGIGGFAHPTIREAWSARCPQWRSASGRPASTLRSGYVTITPEYRLEVSPRLKEDYRNGRSYYPLHGPRCRFPPRRLTRRASTFCDGTTIESIERHDGFRCLNLLRKGGDDAVNRACDQVPLTFRPLNAVCDRRFSSATSRYTSSQESARGPGSCLFVELLKTMVGCPSALSCSTLVGESST